jgi:hypothetical protein
MEETLFAQACADCRNEWSQRLLLCTQGCQIFIATAYQNGKNIPNNQKIYQMAIKYTKMTKIYKITRKYTK